MAEMLPSSAPERIERALARIESVLTDHALERDALTTRHATLRAEMADAIAALDQILASGTE